MQMQQRTSTNENNYVPKNTPEIEQTTNYKQFKAVKGNRPVTQGHIAHLMGSISKKNLLSLYPMIVNEKMEIIDGQHRLHAAKGLGEPIYYIVVQGLGLNEVQQLNTYNKPWRTIEYLNSFCDIGKQKYITFKDFIEGHQITIEQGLILLFGDNNGSIRQTFREGALNYTAEQLEKAMQRARIMGELRPYFIDAGYNSSYWARAIVTVYEKGLAEELLHKVPQAKPQLVRKYSRRDYLRELEEVLNFRMGKNVFRLI